MNMNWTILKTEEDYTEATERLMDIFHAVPNTAEHDELELLSLLIEDYDKKRYQLPRVDVRDIIKAKMQERGLKNKDLEPIIGSKSYVSSILSGERDITLRMAVKLGDFFNLPSDLFLQAQS